VTPRRRLVVLDLTLERAEAEIAAAIDDLARVDTGAFLFTALRHQQEAREAVRKATAVFEMQRGKSPCS
jgi:hypothetical protein